MKLNIIAFLLFILFTSCYSATSNINLKPVLKIPNDKNIVWQGKNYPSTAIDSVLLNFKKSIPMELHDSIQIKIMVSKEVSMEGLAAVKIGLRKNKLLRIIYSRQK